MINSAEFSPFELEDAILQGKTRKALEIIKSLRKADSYSGPLLIWIMAKITNLASIASKNKNPQMYLKNNGVWQSKINDYLSFIKIPKEILGPNAKEYLSKFKVVQIIACGTSSYM